MYISFWLFYSQFRSGNLVRELLTIIYTVSASRCKVMLKMKRLGKTVSGSYLRSMYSKVVFFRSGALYNHVISAHTHAGRYVPEFARRRVCKQTNSTSLYFLERRVAEEDEMRVK